MAATGARRVESAGVWTPRAVARALGISLSTLKRPVKALGLDRAKMSQARPL